MEHTQFIAIADILVYHSLELRKSQVLGSKQKGGFVFIHAFSITTPPVGGFVIIPHFFEVYAREGFYIYVYHYPFEYIGESVS